MGDEHGLHAECRVGELEQPGLEGEQPKGLKEMVQGGCCFHGKAGPQLSDPPENHRALPVTCADPSRELNISASSH